MLNVLRVLHFKHSPVVKTFAFLASFPVKLLVLGPYFGNH